MGRTITNKHNKKVRRDFLLKNDSQLGERKQTAYFISSYRNIFYNILNEHEDLNVTTLSILLWAYPTVFFSSKACVDRLWVGKRNIKKYLNEMIRNGWLEVYSKKFLVEQELERYSDIMDMTYTEVEEIEVKPRYRLTRKASVLAGKVIDELNNGGWQAALIYDDRYEEVMRQHYMKLPSRNRTH